MTLTFVERSSREGSRVTICKADLLGGTLGSDIRKLLAGIAVLLFRGLSPDDGDLRPVTRILGNFRIGTAEGAPSVSCLRKEMKGCSRIARINRCALNGEKANGAVHIK